MNNQTEQISETHNPVRNMGIPQNPVPQTNTGLLEHTGMPITPFENITTIPPDFSWMTSQFKVLTQATIDTTHTVGTVLYSANVLHPNAANLNFIDSPNWERIPFASSIWWKGIVSFRFSIIKPPRVVGKLLIKYRQDNFMNLGPNSPGKDPNIKDDTYRSILKEWDLSATNHFEFDISASLPIRARPTKYPSMVTTPANEGPTAYAQVVPPWINYSMGAISLEVAEMIAPGGIFPDSYQIIVERSFKNADFMTPTDTKSTYLLCVMSAQTKT